MPLLRLHLTQLEQLQATHLHQRMTSQNPQGPQKRISFTSARFDGRHAVTACIDWQFAVR
jgi:hypothetical protein